MKTRFSLFISLFIMACSSIQSNAQSYCSYLGRYYPPEDLENIYYYGGSLGFAWVSDSIPVSSIGPSYTGLDNSYWVIQLDRDRIINKDTGIFKSHRPLIDGQEYGILISFGSEGNSFWYDLGEYFYYDSSGTGSFVGDGMSINNVNNDIALPTHGEDDEYDATEDEIFSHCYFFVSDGNWCACDENQIQIKFYLR